MTTETLPMPKWNSNCHALLPMEAQVRMAGSCDSYGSSSEGGSPSSTDASSSDGEGLRNYNEAKAQLLPSSKESEREREKERDRDL